MLSVHTSVRCLKRRWEGRRGGGGGLQKETNTYPTFSKPRNSNLSNFTNKVKKEVAMHVCEYVGMYMYACVYIYMYVCMYGGVY